MNKNKSIIVGASVIVLAIVFYLLLPVWANIGNLDVYNGKTEIIRGESVKNGQTGSSIKVNDRIKLENDSRSGLILKDNSVIRLESGSEVEVAELEYKEGKIKNAVVSLVFGRIWASVEPVGSEGEFKVETPSLVAAIRGTEFEVIYTNGVNVVYVFSGAVTVALSSDLSVIKEVKTGERFVIREDFAQEDFEKGPSPFDIDRNDDWVIFNIGMSGIGGQEVIVSPSPDLSEENLDGQVSATPKPTATGTPSPEGSGSSVTPSPSTTPIPTPTPTPTPSGGSSVPTATPNTEPKVTSVSPSSVSRFSGSNSFFVNGSNLKSPVQVYLGDVSIQAALLDGQTIIGYVSENIKLGVYDVKVVTDGKTLILKQALTVR